MTPEEMKAQLEQAQAEAKAAKDAAEKAQAELESKGEEINNLDKTAKEQAKSIEDLKKRIMAQPVSLKTAIREGLMSVKADIEKGIKGVADKFEVKFDITTGFANNQSYGVQQDPEIHGAVYAGNAFLAAFPVRPRTGSKLSWIEASTTPVVDYVAELATNSNVSNVTYTEKQREFGKLATKIQISTEAEDWFAALVQYCQNEGQRLILNKLDKELYDGAGADSTQPRKVYGLKTNSTAFAAMAAGAIEKANLADVIMDAQAQVGKAGYNANVCILSFEAERLLKGLKDANGNYIYNQATQMLGAIRVFPSAKVAANEVFVADNNCVQNFAGNGYELEFIRNGAIDGWDVYYRRAAQSKVPTPEKAGVIFVADYAAAITALNK